MLNRAISIAHNEPCQVLDECNRHVANARATVAVATAVAVVIIKCIGIKCFVHDDRSQIENETKNIEQSKLNESLAFTYR